MTVKSQSRGHVILNKNNKWFYKDTGEEAFDDRPCSKCGNRPVGIVVKDGFDGTWKIAKIDFCIAPIVRALQFGGIDMISSCCGHGERDGWIKLADGRTLIIKRLGWDI